MVVAQRSLEVGEKSEPTRKKTPFNYCMNIKPATVLECEGDSLCVLIVRILGGARAGTEEDVHSEVNRTVPT